jgi:hypothetical protein
VITLGPYTYLTLSLQPDKKPQVGVSFYTSRLRIRAGLLDNPRPFLELDSDEAHIHLSTTGAGPVTAADLAIARDLYAAAARYLADCERLHTTEDTAG